MNTKKSALTLRFFSSTESAYEKISLENKQLTYTFFQDSKGRCQQWFQNRPCWQHEDLQTISQSIPAADIQRLYLQIQKSDVMQLNVTLGNTQQQKRAYEQRLYIHDGVHEKHLTYRSRPGAPDKPASFQLVENFLRTQAKNLKDSWTTANNRAQNQ